ncbi:MULTISPECIES: hypothetical protein [Macrococcoides]|uniref:hypothetical protein n=1 Tax=Macrococcoides TaxID=3076173 RepID=UPI000C34CD6D|nr:MULTISPECIES: hypothetical protein [Macrococcus]PKE18448.1 hypothetical protein CW679_10860 [Macrococcus caseolyticus]QNR09071.1 hypothetical protein GL258_12360 [Macrococcus canis]
MAKKITKSKVNKYLTIDEKIEALKKEKEKNEKELALNIGKYFLEKVEITDYEDIENIYTLIDTFLEDDRNNINTNGDVHIKESDLNE